ncbi:hypothetical protein [Chitinophaga sancti]|uniref:Uncharacterized protein n=1 Tax=Chitinophaga sancti TaxID=1004 RepID=A0A1K1MX41_9BACT|nr:hypothetical protein [Chitinophaga sancti]WQD63066.1 hypothetical protein U0033_01570 [Chitinophaga sancti]WQG91309.1 hypothetical protein SR876_07345 [Chitinophaga sancti]SFW27683.1 hypothetical protein SAMN05661012_00971 [Chitinophaga sancti]
MAQQILILGELTSLAETCWKDRWSFRNTKKDTIACYDELGWPMHQF